MPNFTRTEQDIVKDSIEFLSSQTNITQLSPGSKARFLSSTVAREQSSQSSTFDRNLLQPFIRYCDDKFLDFFGDMMNLPRIEPTHAEATDDNFLFYVESGVFGDINNGLQITIPSGTKISIASPQGGLYTPGLTEPLSVSYVTLLETVCPASSSFVYAPIRAVLEGRETSLPENALNEHNFTSYAAASLKKFKCTNRFAIDNGESRETPDSYRYRLLNVFNARQQAIGMAIRLAILNVPGVTDTVSIPSEQGPGTFSVYVLSGAQITSPAIITKAARAVDQVVAYGTRPYILAPIPFGLEFVANINWAPNTSAQIKAKGYTLMKSAADSFLQNLTMGEGFALGDLVSAMLKAAPEVRQFGQTKTGEFEKVYAYRIAPEGFSPGRSLVTGKEVLPLYNNKIVLETATRYKGIQFSEF